MIYPQDDESDEGEDEAAGEKAADASAAAAGEGASAAASTGEATSNGSEKGPGTISTGQFSLVKKANFHFELVIVMKFHENQRLNFEFGSCLFLEVSLCTSEPSSGRAAVNKKPVCKINTFGH